MAGGHRLPTLLLLVLLPALCHATAPSPSPSPSPSPATPPLRLLVTQPNRPTQNNNNHHLQATVRAALLAAAPPPPPTPAPPPAPTAPLVVLPEGFLGDTLPPATAEAHCCATAVDEHTAVLCPFHASAATTDAVLCGPTGNVLLRHSMARGNTTNPTSAAANPSAVIAFGGFNLCVQLGTGFWFMEEQRVLMLRGCEVLLHPVSQALDFIDGAVLQARAQENVMIVATSNWAGLGGGGSAVDSYCAVRDPDGALITDGLWRHSSRPRPLPASTDCPPSVVLNNTRADTLVFDPKLPDDMHQFRRHHTIGGDVCRRPTQYLPLCYPQMRRPPVRQPAASAAGPADEPLVINVGLLQMQAVQVPAGEDPTRAHGDKAEQFCRQAKSMGADVVVMPEQWSVGYETNYPKPTANMTDWAAQYAWWQFAQPQDGPFLKRFQQLARELEMAIAVSYLEAMASNDGPSGGAWAADRTPTATPPRNSVALFDAQGRLLYNYAKVHTVLADQEEALTSAGRGWPVATLSVPGKGNLTVGSEICFDREHPESPRLLAVQGAELVLAPTACRIANSMLDEWAARGFENAISLAQANYVQSPGMDWMNGRSSAVSFSGSFAQVASQTQEGVFIAAFNITAQRQHRATARGAALTSPPFTPTLCNMAKAPGFAPPPELFAPGYTFLQRAEQAL